MHVEHHRKDSTLKYIQIQRGFIECIYLFQLNQSNVILFDQIEWYMGQIQKLIVSASNQ